MMTTETEQWRRKGSFFTFAHKHKIFYRADGDVSKPCLVLIHGFPSSSLDFDSIWSDLTQDFYVVTFDMLGFGFSDKPYWHTYSIIEQADICSALLHKLEISTFHILAHDYGVSVAQELLSRPHSIKSTTFLNGGLFPEVHRPLLTQRLLLVPILGALLTFTFTRRTLQRTLKGIFGIQTQPSKSFVDNTYGLLLYKRGWLAMHRLIRYIPDRVAHRTRWVGALQNEQVKKVFIVGMQDPISGSHMALHYRSNVRNAYVIELQNVGHYPQVEDPNGVLQAFRSFHRGLAKS